VAAVPAAEAAHALERAAGSEQTRTLAAVLERELERLVRTLRTFARSS
jgi:hypothetical protein